MEKICGIYKIVNKINRKVYIGQSIDIYRRWKDHRGRSQHGGDELTKNRIYQDMYGHLDDFDFYILEKCDKIDLNAREIYWISHYNSTNPEYGYNVSKGGQEGSGYSQLSDDKVLEIVMSLENTRLSQAEIAKKYNVTQQTISYINIGGYSACHDMDIDEFPIRKRNCMTGLNKYRVDHKKRVYCSICGKQCSKRATICRECRDSMSRNKAKTNENEKEIQKAKEQSLRFQKPMRLTRDELKNLIRNTSFTEIGRMFDVSSVTIKKWCKKYNLPFKVSEIKLYNDYEWENEVPYKQVLKRVADEVPPTVKKYVEQVDMSTGNVVAIYSNTSEAKKALGVKKTTLIARCCDGRKESYRGFIWRYRLEYIN